MSDKKINIPENYDEALKRKNEVLEMINKYNELMFTEGATLPFTDEEIALLQEEYLILDEYVGLTDQEKEAYQKLESNEYVEHVQEDGTVVKVKKETFWDKVNPIVFIYAVLPLIGSLTSVIQGIGIGSINLFGKLLGKIVEKNDWSLENITDNQLFALSYGLMLIYPIVFCLITFLLYKFACRKKETKSVFFWILIGHIALSIISCVIIFIELFKSFF